MPYRETSRFEGLDAIDWTSLGAPFMPDAIRGAAAAPKWEGDPFAEGEEASNFWWNQLSATVVHQGTVYRHSARACPYIVELLRGREAEDMAHGLDTLGFLGHGFAVDSVLRECRRAVRREASFVLEHVEDDDPWASACAVTLVPVVLPPPTAAALLLDQLERGRSAEHKAVTLIALAWTGRHDVARPLLERALSAEAPFERFAGAAGLSILDGGDPVDDDDPFDDDEHWELVPSVWPVGAFRLPPTTTPEWW